MRIKLIIALGSLGGASLSCWVELTEHCGNNLGDASCPDGQFCSICDRDSGEDYNGCIDFKPTLLCHVEGPDTESSGSSEETDLPSTTSTTGTTGMDSVDTTAATTPPPMCTTDDDCPGTDAPFCGPEGECVSCDQTPDPDGACAGQDPLAPLCVGGTCVPCTLDQAGACGGQTPVCTPDNECVPCTEHAQCPQSACHLDGDLVGACFDRSEVVPIANAMELSNSLGLLGMNERAVFVLAPGTYGTTIDVGMNIELAILGNAGDPAILAGDGGPFALDVFGEALVYLADVRVSNISGGGLVFSGTPSVWLDDTEVSSNAGLGLDAAVGCVTHLRRSLVVANDLGGFDMAGGELYIRNSVVSVNGDSLTSLIGGMRLDGTVVDITYTTIVGNQASNTARSSLFCAGSGSGVIRNSIIAAAGNTIDGCEMVAFEGNAVDEASLGGSNVDVGSAVPAWFVDPGTNDFHLSVTGEGDLGDIALWQQGDPLTDVDGDPIPMGTPSHPGFDQP